MKLTRLHLHQFRSYAERVFQFDPHLTAIIGPNGSGKTNILEAIHTLCMGKSFRDGDDELITYNHEWYRVEGEMGGVTRELRYQPGDKGKRLLIDGASKGRFTYRHQLPVVLFEPDDLLMIHASPGSRRKYIDELLQKLYPPLRTTFHRYERVLTQRNNLLKSYHSLAQLKDDVFVWDLSLSELGASIINARKKLIRDINTHISGIYSQVAGSPQSVALGYSSDLAQPVEASLLVSRLSHQLSQDAHRGFTTVGPHRDEIEYSLNDKLAKHTASRGEVRSIVLSLKMLETRFLEEAHGVTPLLLLDDVFSELDEPRQSRLLDHGITQTILTSTQLPLSIPASKAIIQLK